MDNPLPAESRRRDARYWCSQQYSNLKRLLSIAHSLRKPIIYLSYIELRNDLFDLFRVSGILSRQCDRPTRPTCISRFSTWSEGCTCKVRRYEIPEPLSIGTDEKFRPRQTKGKSLRGRKRKKYCSSTDSASIATSQFDTHKFFPDKDTAHDGFRRGGLAGERRENPI